MSLHLFEFEDLIIDFIEHEEFAQIYQQLEAEYLFDAFNFKWPRRKRSQ